MSDKANLVVIAYDTPSDRRRRHIVRALEDVADRVQYSVFEGWLTDEQLDSVWYRLQQLIEDGEDEVRLYRLCSYCRSASRVASASWDTEPAEYWIV